MKTTFYYWDRGAKVTVLTTDAKTSEMPAIKRKLEQETNQRIYTSKKLSS